MRSISRFVVAAAFCAALLGLAPSARAVDVRFEVGPMVSIPLNPLMDGLPLELPQGPITEQLGVGAQREIWLLDLSLGTGGGVSLALLLDDWEIRYEFAALPWETLTVTHVQFPDYTSVFYWPSESFTNDGAKPSVSISSELDAIFVHTVGFGYRFTPWNWVVHPYFPLNLAFTAAQLRNGGETLLGFNVQLGVGLQWDVVEAFRIGLVMRYGFSAYKNPDTTFSRIRSAGIQSAVTNASSFEAVMETLQTLSFGAHASYRF